MSKVIEVNVEFYYHTVGISYHKVEILYNKVKIKHISENIRLGSKYLISTNIVLANLTKLIKTKN